MNRAVYRHLLHTYGRQPLIWLGIITEFIRTIAQRMLVTVIVAHMAANLAAHHISTAKHDAVLFLVVYVSGALIGALGEISSIRAEDNEYQVLMMNFYRKLTGKDMSFYRDSQTGYLVSAFRQYLDSSMILLRQFRGDIVKTTVSLLAPLVVLTIASRALGLVATVIVIVQIAYVVWASSKANHYRKLTHEIYRKVTGEVSDQITNIVAFKSGGVEKRATAKMQQLARQETELFWLRRKVVMKLDVPRELITAVSVTAAFFVVFSAHASQSATVGLVILTLTYMFQIVRSVSDLPTIITQHDDLVTKLYPTLAYLDSDHETIRDPAKPKKLLVSKGVISIDQVGFSYPAHGGDENQRISVFQGLNIHIKGGEQIGVVGLSGAGKSTLVSLLMRFDDVESGAIRIDGTDIREVRQSDLHQKIAFVPQEPLLFHSTIRENIAYFNDSTTDMQIIAAAKAAHAYEFIEKLPNGLDTIVGERGVKLSGGQKQRVVIARAILKNAPIMIFDEATSALDTESEKIIQRALPQIMGKHTAIVIAHRLSTVAGLDHILVMEDGKIAESGTHDELLKQRGRYYSLWQKQITA
ncbi:MAG TPA: ABC transporter ATP-binding protein [Candidatus Saccharimonadales bacterium]|nr:ABC transporter ATP-binding protein [Candidatus Saccharimonadales bacterium]